VALSVVIAIQGSFVGLKLAGELERLRGLRARAALAGAALTLATGVWSMHFVGMLAANFPSAIDYLVLPTLISFLICVLVVGVGVYLAHSSEPRWFRIGAGGAAMGLGITLMHYVGMAAVHLAGPTSQEPAYVAASLAVSIAASAFALWTLDNRPTKSRFVIGAIGLGLAISGMHYTAMAGMRLDPSCFDVSRFVGADSALSRNTLALLTTLVAFGVSGAFLLSLVPDAEAAAATAEEALPRGKLEEVAVLPAGEGVAPVETPRAENAIPVEKEGRLIALPAADIFAVRANAHYTYIHDGHQEYFCSLSISAVEARLDKKRFHRVHRSHIVAVDRITRIKRAGENGIAELGAPSVQCSIPIARGQLREVRRLVEAAVS
jgi:NO-binding membrane sensor protein with MHYT domain